MRELNKEPSAGSNRTETDLRGVKKKQVASEKSASLKWISSWSSLVGYVTKSVSKNGELISIRLGDRIDKKLWQIPGQLQSSDKSSSCMFKFILTHFGDRMCTGGWDGWHFEYVSANVTNVHFVCESFYYKQTQTLWNKTPCYDYAKSFCRIKSYYVRDLCSELSKFGHLPLAQGHNKFWCVCLARKLRNFSSDRAWSWFQTKAAEAETGSVVLGQVVASSSSMRKMCVDVARS